MTVALGTTLAIALPPGTVLHASVVPNATVNLTINLSPAGPSVQGDDNDDQGDDNDDQADDNNDQGDQGGGD